MQRSRAFWEQIVSEYDAKGSMTKAEFCSAYDVKRPTLDYWRRKFRDEQSIPDTTSFVRVGPAATSTQQPSAQMRIHVGSTLVLELPLSVDPHQLTAILQAAATV